MNATVAPSDRFPTFARLGRVRRWFLLCSALPIFLAAVYALSFGPAVMMAQRRAIRTETLESIYLPLEMTAAIVPGGDWLLKRYVGLWAADDPDP